MRCCLWVAQGFSAGDQENQNLTASAAEGMYLQNPSGSAAAAKANHPAVSEIAALKRLRHPKSFGHK